jgi:hypothetical protein
MTIADLRRAMDRRPFRPFVTHLADEREVKVWHPNALTWGREDSPIVLCTMPGGGQEVIDIRLVTSLESEDDGDELVDSVRGGG